jgi:hypothetical protein
VIGYDVRNWTRLQLSDGCAITQMSNIGSFEVRIYLHRKADRGLSCECRALKSHDVPVPHKRVAESAKTPPKHAINPTIYYL